MLRIFKLFVLPACIAGVMTVETASLVTQAAGPQATPGSGGAIKKVTMIADSGLDGPARYGIGKLEAALRAKGVAVSEDETQVSGSDLVLLAGIGGRGAAAVALTGMRVAAPSGAEALAVSTAGRYRNKPAIVLAGSDGTGLMYAALDLADRVGWTRNGANPFQFARST